MEIRILGLLYRVIQNSTPTSSVNIIVIFSIYLQTLTSQTLVVSAHRYSLAASASSCTIPYKTQLFLHDLNDHRFYIYRTNRNDIIGDAAYRNTSICHGKTLSNVYLFLWTFTSSDSRPVRAHHPPSSTLTVFSVVSTLCTKTVTPVISWRLFC